MYPDRDTFEQLYPAQDTLQYVYITVFFFVNERKNTKLTWILKLKSNDFQSYPRRNSS